MLVQDPLAGAAAPPAAPPQHDQAAMDEMLAKERERHDEQLKLETRAREELEDMILRIEKHFKAEQVRVMIVKGLDLIGNMKRKALLDMLRVYTPYLCRCMQGVRKHQWQPR